MDIQPIRIEEDYENALNRVEKLMDATPNSPEEAELEVLATLIESYEAKHFPLPDADPIEVIKFVMEQSGMMDKDLVPFIGRSGRVSEVLTRKRSLSIMMIRKLHKGLGIPAESLIKEYEVA